MIPPPSTGLPLPEGFLAPPGHAIEGVAALGGMGTILRAREESTGRLVALKVLKRSSTNEARRRFTSEARLTAALEHPNIVPVHTIGSTPNGSPFYTMKFVRGKTLRAILEALARGDSATTDEYPLPVLLTVFQKSAKPSASPTDRASSTAISSPTTSCSATSAKCSSWTGASQKNRLRRCRPIRRFLHRLPRFLQHPLRPGPRQPALHGP